LKKLVTLKCPCCKATLEFNREQGIIERSWAAGATQEAPDLLSVADEAARKAAEDVDMGALAKKARAKSEGLDDAFRKAAEKAKEAIDRGEKPENPFDNE
jgi:hypothetical protein